MDLQGFYGQDHERKEMLAPIGSADIPSAVGSATASAVSVLYPSPSLKRRRVTPPPCERIMIYVRQENELVYTPLHLVPPTSMGLLNAVSLRSYDFLSGLPRKSSSCSTLPILSQFWNSSRHKKCEHGELLKLPFHFIIIYCTFFDQNIQEPANFKFFSFSF